MLLGLIKTDKVPSCQPTAPECDSLIVKALTRARNTVNKGWVQHRMYKRGWFRDSYCVLSAINHACHGDGNNGVDTANIFAVANGIKNIDLIPRWNDCPLRTKSEVVEGFNNAISYCKKHGF